MNSSTTTSDAAASADFRRYTRRALASMAGLALAVAAINVVVDPYGYFGLNTLGVYISAEREAKAVRVLRQPHDALLLGNSKEAMIPVSELRGYRFYNAAFGGGQAQEIEEFVVRFIRQEKLVVLGVDLGQHTDPSLTGDQFARWRPGDVIDKSLNLKTLEYSFRTIGNHFEHKPQHMSADGSFVPTRWFELYDQDRPAEMQYKINNLNQAYDQWARPPGTAMEPFQHIAQILRERNIPCVVLIPPLHEQVVRHLQSLPDRAKFEIWKRELQAIFPVVVDLSESSWSRADNFFKCDPSHFKPDVGAKLINEEVLPRVAPWPAGPAAAGSR